MDAKFSGEDLDNTRIADRVGMRYREQAELDYYRTLYLHEGRRYRYLLGAFIRVAIC